PSDIGKRRDAVTVTAFARMIKPTLFTLVVFFTNVPANRKRYHCLAAAVWRCYRKRIAARSEVHRHRNYSASNEVLRILLTASPPPQPAKQFQAHSASLF